MTENSSDDSSDVSDTATGSTRTDELIDAGDFNKLPAHIDTLSGRRDLDELLRLRHRLVSLDSTDARASRARSQAEYVLAIKGEPKHLRAVLVDGAGRFAPGPLTEVVAANHGWDVLDDVLPPGPMRNLLAFERAVRNEDDVVHDASLDTDLFDLPLAIEDFEPVYPVATYTDEGAEFPRPHIDYGTAFDLPPEPRFSSDLTSTEALLELVRPWTEESNGTAGAVVVEGDVVDAVAAFGHTRAAVVAVAPADALAQLAWVAASGGAHGRRRGAAAGRFSVWWTIAAIAGLADDWPVEPEDIADSAESLGWYLWETNAAVIAGEPHTTPWYLNLAVTDKEHNLAWAISARDERLDD